MIIQVAITTVFMIFSTWMFAETMSFKAVAIPLRIVKWIGMAIALSLLFAGAAMTSDISPLTNWPRYTGFP